MRGGWDLTTDEQDLLAAAVEAAQKSYSPYSSFPVGAAVRTLDRGIYPGCNIENASYGLTVCAERAAIFNAVINGHSGIQAIAVVCLAGEPTQPHTLMPCGACRQVLTEFMPPDGVVIVNCVGAFSLNELLPQPFNLSLPA